MFSGQVKIHQLVSVPGPDLIFSASFQAHSNEGPFIGFSGTGIAQIGLRFFDEEGNRLGETVLVNHVKNPFADTPLIGVPRFKDNTYQANFIEFSNDQLYQNHRIDIRQQVESKLLGVDPESIRKVAVIIWCGATHRQAGTELWITDITLQAKHSLQ